MAETRVDAWRFGSTYVVAISGILDFAAAVQLRLVLFEQLDLKAREVVVDLSAVPMLDASAVGTLVAVREQLLRRGGGLRVQGANAMARQVLEVTGAAKGLLDDVPVDRPAQPPAEPVGPGRWGPEIDSLVADFTGVPTDHPDRARLRERLIEACLPFAERLARRFYGLGEPAADLNQVAALGLVQAVDRYDPRRGTDLSRYAATTIIGGLKRHFRDRGWSVRVPRRLKEMRLEMNRAAGALTQDLGRSPTVSDMAEHLHVGEDRVVEALVAANGYRASSLHVPTRARHGTTAPAHWLGGEDEHLQAVEDRAVLQAALAALPEREQRILVLRYYGNQTQQEIATQLGISQMHVSRLLSGVLNRLRGELLPPDAPTGDRPARSRPRAGRNPDAERV